MKIVVNGEDRVCGEGLILIELIDELKVIDKVMAVAVNMEIVKREDWGSCELKDGDRVELLQFVGGG
jgi:sulfur carrier protein